MHFKQSARLFLLFLLFLFLLLLYKSFNNGAFIINASFLSLSLSLLLKRERDIKERSHLIDRYLKCESNRTRTSAREKEKKMSSRPSRRNASKTDQAKQKLEQLKQLKETKGKKRLDDIDGDEDVANVYDEV